MTKRSTFGNAKDQIKCEINSQKMNCKRCHDVATYISHDVYGSGTSKYEAGLAWISTIAIGVCN